VSFSGDEVFLGDEADEAAADEASAGEASAGHDIVHDAQDVSEKESLVSSTARDDATNDPQPSGGWDTTPTILPSAYFQGEIGYSKFYPPEARDYAYKRTLMVAVDGSVESEKAVEWTVQHLCRSGDLLQIVHCCIAGAIDPRLASYYSGPSIMNGDQISLGFDVARNREKTSPLPEYPEEFPKRPMYDDSWAPTHLKLVRVGPSTGSRPTLAFERFASDPENTSRRTSSLTRNCRTRISQPPCSEQRPCSTTRTRSSGRNTVRVLNAQSRVSCDSA
jgi:hypothetical protein